MTINLSSFTCRQCVAKNGGMSHKEPDWVTYFARTNFDLGNKIFGIKQTDRLSHVYTIGQTG